MADRRARPRAGLSRAKVLDAALALVDEHGLTALSMRRLGAELGVEAMSLYHHVPNKDALLDGLVERLLDQAVGPGADPPGSGQSGPGWVRDFADALHANLRRHPAVLPLLATRPVNSPAALAMTEVGLARLRADGLSLAHAMDLLNAVTVFVIGHTLAEVGTTPGHPAPAPDLDDLSGLDPAGFPNIAEIVRTRAGLDFDRRLRTTVTILVSGYLALDQDRQGAD